MKFVSRAAWGARPSKGTLASVSGVRGTKVHYEGAPVPAALAGDHTACVRHMRDLQASHLANTAENYTDIAYNAVVCPHGYVFEGRGAGKRTGANGNRALNSAHYAVCGMVGTAGITEPTDAMLHGIRDAIEWLRDEGDAGPEIRGHRDGYATSCPGPDLYAWVQRGAPRPGDPAPEQPSPPPPPPPPASRPVVSLRAVRNSAIADPPKQGTPTSNFRDVAPVEHALVAEGLLIAARADGHFGTDTRAAYAAWQRSLGYTGSDADGIPGMDSLRRLGAKRGFEVTA